MTNILFISHYLRVNGTENFMMNVFRHLDKSLFHIDFLLFSNEDTVYTKEVKEHGSRVFHVPSRKESPIGWYTSLNKFFKTHKGTYHAIHFCGGSLTSVAPMYYAWKYGIPVRIVHSHSTSAFGLHNVIMHRIKRRFIRKICTHYLACSTEAADWFYAGAPSTIIKNGIDVDLFRYSDTNRKKTRETLNISQDAFVLGHVGRFTAEKNHTFIIDVFKKLHSINRNSHLLLIGEGDLLETSKEKVEALGLTTFVHFLGQRSDVNDMMQAMDCFIMPSTFEGLPFVLIEAQCSGLPCCISENVSQESGLLPSTKFLALSTSIDTWVNSILELPAHSDRRQGASIIAEKGYSINDSIKTLENIYTSQK